MTPKTCLCLIVCLMTMTTTSADTLEVRWNAAFMQGKKVGYLHQVRESKGDTVITTQVFDLQLNRGTAVSVTSHMTSTVWETKDGKPLRFAHERSTGKAVRKVSGSIVDGKRLRFAVEAGGEIKNHDIPWKTDAVLFEGIWLLTTKNQPREGLTFSYTTFDFDVLDYAHMESRVGPKKEIPGIPALLHEVKTTTSVAGAKIEGTGYVDSAWTEKKSIIDLGAISMEMIDCSREVALGANDQFDIMTSMQIRTPAGSGNPASGKSAGYELQLPPDIVLPSSDEQKVTSKGAITTVRVTKIPPPKKISEAALPESVSIFLKPSRHVESDAPGIVALAKKTVKDVKDPMKSALKIRDLARSYIKTKSLDVGFASALEVLTLKEGDCTEHAVFTAALCRAAGIPARVVVGIVRPSWSTSFLHHAWTQVYINGVWISIDSALGEFHPGYIALDHDAKEDNFVRLGTTMGRIAISKLTVE